MNPDPKYRVGDLVRCKSTKREGVVTETNYSVDFPIAVTYQNNRIECFKENSPSLERITLR